MAKFSKWYFRSINGEQLLARGSCVVEDVVELKFTLRNGPNGIFASIPAEKYTSKDGQTKYNRHWYFVTRELTDSFQAAVVKEYQKFTSNVTSGEESQVPSKAKGDNLPF